MLFQFLVTAEVSHSEGRFSTRDDLDQLITDAIEQANPGDLTGENDGEYTIDTWTVESYTAPKQPAQPRKKTPREIVQAIEKEIGIPVTRPPGPRESARLKLSGNMIEIPLNSEEKAEVPEDDVQF